MCMTDAEGVSGESDSDGGVAGTLSPEASANALDARELYEEGLLTPEDDFLDDWSPPEEREQSAEAAGAAATGDAAADDRPVGSVTIIEQGKSERSSLPPIVLGAVVLVPMALVLTIVAYVFAGETSAYLVGGLFGALFLTLLGFQLRRGRAADGDADDGDADADDAPN